MMKSRAGSSEETVTVRERIGKDLEPSELRAIAA
jgi:hypothetical protein